jgi:hypothetical protein
MEWIISFRDTENSAMHQISLCPVSINEKSATDNFEALLPMVFRSVWLGHLIKVAVDERVGEGGGHAQQVTHGEGDTEPDVTGAALLAENNVLSSCENMLCRGGRKRERVRERDRERESDGATFQN